MNATITLKTNARPSLAFLIETDEYFTAITGCADVQSAMPDITRVMTELLEQGDDPIRVLSLYGSETLTSPTGERGEVGMCEVLWGDDDEHLSSRPVEIAVTLATLDSLGISLHRGAQA